MLFLPVLAGVGAALFVLNPWMNPGPLFFVQTRMGQGRRAFSAIKFRTMAPPSGHTRGAHDPVEADRIPPLGAFLRRTRLDELPQFLNILSGEMSFIGPRPDFMDHARVYLEIIPTYHARLTVKPGLTGLSQVTLGYAQTPPQARAKVACDLVYLRSRCLRLDLWIIWRTLITVLTSRGQ